MLKIRSGIDAVVKEFGLEKYLSKPQRVDAEEIKLFLVTNPSFAKAKDLDRNGKWKEAAEEYYSLYTLILDPIQKAKAFISLSQMYINLVMYNSSRNFLVKNREDILSALSGCDRIFYEAQIFEKLGWINDYFGEIDEAVDNFSRSKQLLSEKAKTDDEVLRVYETSNHFLGRQYAILADQGKDIQKNIIQAIERFEESIQIYEKLRGLGNADDAAEGFQYAWIARMHILQDDYQKAEDDLSKMQDLFSRVLEKHHGSGAMGYYYLLMGRLKFEQGDYKTAKENFAEALRINTEIVSYTSSQADALLGMGLCSFFLDNKKESKEEIEKALSLNPSLLYRGYI